LQLDSSKVDALKDKLVYIKCVKFGTFNFNHWQAPTHLILKTSVSQCFKIGDKPGFGRAGQEL